jgi:translation elongation factor EF-1beta
MESAATIVQCIIGLYKVLKDDYNIDVDELKAKIEADMKSMLDQIANDEAEEKKWFQK